MQKILCDSKVMEELLKDSADFALPQPGTLVEGRVVTIHKNKVLVDLNGTATGIIFGQEAHDSAGTIKTLQVGDSVSAFVLEEEDEAGLVVLSLRRASQQKSWKRFVDAYENDTTIEVKATEANKGGLLLNIDGIKGFIPVSQLAPLHYPRVNGADAAQILARLQKLVGIPLNVKIINCDKEGGKLILSERAAEKEEREKAMGSLEVGKKVKGKISGIVNFGIFVTFEGLEGLVHISEIAWGHVRDPNDYGKLGDEIEVLVIGKDDDKISLSMKRLTPDPWIEAAKKYSVGKMVKGQVSRVTAFGAFVKLDDDINGLIHISEISEDEVSDPNKHLSIGDEIEAKIISIDTKEHRVGLSIKNGEEKAAKKEEESEQSE
jgi:small subunit ribosomal protein S1